MTLRASLTAMVLVASLTGITACSQSKDEVLVELLSTGEPAAHSVANPQLRQMMKELEALVIDKFYSDEELAQMEGHYFSRAADASTNLILLAENVRVSGFRLGLDDDDRALYVKLAARLQEQAADFGGHLAARRYAAARPALKGMLATCQECHQLFRKGEPPAPGFSHKNTLRGSYPPPGEKE